ncbi:MAG: hypothetical protein LUC97_02740 [Clostridiales bacterium]|nr:hypothetical protein [Clostridiales bacterium]MCD8214551.1 hypothetical protein [Clostridiales bacterium]
MKKKYEKPDIYVVEIKGGENIADSTSSFSNGGVQITGLYGTISYSNLKSDY